jgi:uncharacterized protein YajQ (UPF0234 family)
VVKKLNLPMLILQGERDYQVLKKIDFMVGKTALKERSNVNFKLFPKLNHLFIKWKGKSTPEEYTIEGHVDEEVITTIVNFIKDSELQQNPQIHNIQQMDIPFYKIFFRKFHYKFKI